MNNVNLPQDELSQKVKTILIVENDIYLGKFLVEALQEETPYHALLAGDAIKALEMMKTHAPALLLLDYILPGMNGLELYDYLQAQEQFSNASVLLMSAYISERKLREVSSVAFIAKPFDLDKLIQRIDELLAA